MTRRTAGTSPARYSNDFEPSPSALPLDALLSTSEVAALIGVSRVTVAAWAKVMGVPCVTKARGPGHVHYWSRQQVERLRDLS